MNQSRPKQDPRVRGATGAPGARPSPRTSVLIPAYNSAATIRETVESALAQTMPELEVIVVDDGSAEPIADALAETRDPRLRVLRHGRNRGLSAARNTALAAARAPLVSQLDHDDLWEPDYLESVLPLFADPGIGLVYANAMVIGHPEGLEAIIPDASVHPMDTFPKIAEQCPIPALTATMRTEAVRAVGGYARWLWGTQDYHLYLKLVKAGWRFGYVDRRLARYRWPHGRGMSQQHRDVERDALKMWFFFMLRHPTTPGPRRQVRTHLKAEIARRRRPR